MIGRKYEWFRNSSEQEQDKPHGSGTLVAIMNGLPECKAIILDTDRNLIEKPLSLVKASKTTTIKGK